MKPPRRKILYFFIFGFLMLLAWEKHYDIGIFNYHAELWADKSGYYVYLPSMFIYDFDATQFPEKIDTLTGTGFSFSADGKVETKYTSGVAMMEAPFFLGAHIIAPLFGYPRDGFSEIYQRSINVAAVFYLTLAFYLLIGLLRQRFSQKISWIALALTFFGTNLYYYGISDTAMSHVYSFFFFVLFLHLSNRIASSGWTWGRALALGIVAGFIVLIRPVNLLFFPVFFFFDVTSWQEVKQRFTLLLKPQYIALAVVAAFVVFIPQMLYWKYLSGDYIYYSYGEEGFVNLAKPPFRYIWFSPSSGLFIYNPLVLVMVAGMVAMLLLPGRRLFGGYLLFTFLLITYVFCSWWAWHYGCSYGSRPYVEFYALFIFPLAYFLRWLSTKKKLWRYALIPLVIMCWYNLRLVYQFDICWFHGVWDYEVFFKYLIEKHGVLQKLF